MHRIEKCRHGEIVAQCRCPSPSKPVVRVDCPPPFRLHEQARGNRDEYLRLLKLHEHLIPKAS